MGLSPDLELRATCRWALYEVRPHVLSLMNSVSDKYIGMTFGGGIACNSSSFGSWQQLDMDLRQRKVTLSRRRSRSSRRTGAAAATWNVIEMGSLGWVSRSGTRRRGIALGGGGIEFLDAHEVPTFADQA